MIIPIFSQQVSPVPVTAQPPSSARMSADRYTPSTTSTVVKGTVEAHPTPAMSIGDLLFCDAMSAEETESRLATLGAKQLRTECYLRQLRIIKKGPDANDHKLGYIALLMQQKCAFAEMQRLAVEEGPSKALALPAEGARRRTRHCMLRLLNVMFSDEFVSRIDEIDRRPTRAELDSNEIHANSSFWTDFHAIFVKPRADLDKLASNLAAFSKCNPGFIVRHDASKLREMWKDVSSRYALALANSRVSGMHDNDFFAYCSGKIDVLYMHEWLETKPGLLEAVEGKLPKRARLNTMQTESDSESDDQPKSKKHRSTKSPTKVDRELIVGILDTLRSNNSTAEALEQDCRFAQLVASLSSLMALRERMLSALQGIYTAADLEEVNADIAHVRAKKKAMLSSIGS